MRFCLLRKPGTRGIRTGRRLRRWLIGTPMARAVAPFAALAFTRTVALPRALVFTLAALGAIGSPAALVAPRLVRTSLAT